MNYINLVLICDDEYIVPTMVTLYSIFQSKNSTSSIVANIIVTTQNRENYAIINKLEREDFKVNIIYESLDKVKHLDSHREETYCSATKSALLKFFISDLIKGIDKVLYLDGDILVRKDLTELYAIDVSDYYSAVVIDSGKLYSGREIVKNTKNYFNSGVMLLNIERMKSVTGELISTKLNQQDKILMDQDVFNEVIGSNILTLPIKYNFLFTNLARSCDKFGIGDLNNLYHTNYANIREIYMDSYILHFSSKDKPWKCTKAPMARKWYECYRAMKRELCNCEDIETIKNFEEDLPKDLNLQNAIRGKEFDVERQFIISFTTYPARMERVFQTIDSLFDQIEVADKIILCLAVDEWNSRKELPDWLENYKKRGLEILWGEKNLKPHTKYFYSMQKFPEDIIITVDDDLIYNNKTTYTLIQSYIQYPDCVSANRVHVISFDENKNLLPYMQWKQQFQHCVLQPNMALLPTGVAGVLYPPHCLGKEAFDVHLIEDLCPTTDDLWLKIMCAKNGKNIVCASPFFVLNTVEELQSTGLYRMNRTGGENDRQLNNIWNFFVGKEDVLWKKKIYQDYLVVNTLYKAPLFSVLMPVCEKECDILASVNSLLNQNIDDIEIIILDNGSKAKRLLDFMGQLKIKLVIDNFITRAQAANFGLKLAQGEYILIADPNVIYHKDFLEKVLLKGCYGNADILCYKVNYWDSISGKIRFSDWENKFHCFPVYETFSFDEIAQDRFAAFSYRLCDKVIRREFLIKQKVRFKEEGSCYGDMNFIYTLLMNAQKIAVINESLGEQGFQSVTRHIFFNQWMLIRCSMLEFKEKLEKSAEVWCKYRQDYINFALFVCINEYKYEHTEYIEEHYNQLKTDFKDFDIIPRDEKFFYNKHLYQVCQYICSVGFDLQEVNKFVAVDAARIKTLERENNILRREIKEMEERQMNLVNCQYSLDEIRKSRSYRWGRTLTYFPRLIRHILFRCGM